MTYRGIEKVIDRVIKGTKILAEIKECNPGTKTRHGNKAHTKTIIK